MEIIHIVLGKANPNRMNGVNKVVYQLATEQVAHGECVSVWGITKNLDVNYDNRAFKTELFKTTKNIFKPSEIFLNAILQKKGKAIFHIHGGWIPVFYAISRFMAENKIPYVFTPHGAYNKIAMKRSFAIKKAYFSLFERSIIKNASKIHCIGESEIAGLEEIYKTKKSVLLPYGLKLSSQETYLKGQTDHMIIGFVGRLDIYTKGLDLLITGFGDFNKCIPNSRLWLIGDGTERAKLEKMILEKGIHEQVVLFGGKFGEEKDNLIKQMDVFVHTSRNEGLPSSVLEASNFGIPCIVSQATNISKHVTNYNAGIGIENENSKAFSNALFQIYSLWETQSLLPMKLNAQRMVKTEFNWNKLIPKFNELYTI